ncbi:MAG: hypothetical protein WDM81_19355 [Rhizomicrobium sp.]
MAPGIAVPSNAVSIAVNAQGQVAVTVPGQTAPQVVGTLELNRFANDSGLKPIGNNLFLETPSSGAPQAGVPGLGRLRHAAAGLPRDLERQCGGRDHLADHGAARL